MTIFFLAKFKWHFFWRMNLFIWNYIFQPPKKGPLQITPKKVHSKSPQKRSTPNRPKKGPLQIAPKKVHSKSPQKQVSVWSSY